MITNERQYRNNKTLIQRFTASLEQMQQSQPPIDVHPRIWQAEQEAIQSQIEELSGDVLAYEKLKSGQVRSFAVDSLEGLPLALIQARIAQGLTQKDLANRLGVREQQVQQDEENLYSSASLRRLKQLAEVLNVEMLGKLELVN